jgi:hypothetical protein
MLSQPNKVHIHCGPSLRNIFTADKGKVPPRTYLKIASEAIALAL